MIPIVDGQLPAQSLRDGTPLVRADCGIYLSVPDASSVVMVARIMAEKMCNIPAPERAKIDNALDQLTDWGMDFDNGTRMTMLLSAMMATLPQADEQRRAMAVFMAVSIVNTAGDMYEDVLATVKKKLGM